MYNEDFSKVSYSILVSVGKFLCDLGEVGYLVVSGNCRAAISKNYG